MSTFWQNYLIAGLVYIVVIKPICHYIEHKKSMWHLAKERTDGLWVGDDIGIVLFAIVFAVGIVAWPFFLASFVVRLIKEARA